MSDNWLPLAKFLKKQCSVIIPDLPNHGNSPHTNIFDYNFLSNTINNFLINNMLKKVSIIGHSLGGKIAMQFANDYPNKVDKLIVADISPKSYSEHFFKEKNNHKKIQQAIANTKVENCKNLKEIENQLFEQIKDIRTCKFLLKNIKKTENKKFAWKLNIDTIINSSQNLIKKVNIEKLADKKIYFIKGEKSEYISEEDIDYIKKYLPNSQIFEIKNAGHWLHAENPTEFFNTVKTCLSN